MAAHLCVDAAFSALALSQKGHRRQPLYARATQELQQHGLGLIIGIMCEHDVVGSHRAERGIPRITCRGFQAVAPGYPNLDDTARQSALSACGTAEARPPRSV